MNNAVIEKLKKILALANCKGAQPGEVEAAMAKAREIALQNEIELSSIDLNSEEKTKDAFNVTSDASLRTRSKFKQPYHRWIFSVLQTVFKVTVIEHSHNTYNGVVVSRITLVGAEVDVAIAKEVFTYLEGIFPATFRRFITAGQLVERAAHMNGCYRGLYFGIVEANKKEEAKMTQTGNWALVVRKKEDLVKAKVAEMFPNLKNSRNTKREMSAYAEGLGYEKGKAINLRQVQGAKASSSLR
jgi:hypothetical protein